MSSLVSRIDRLSARIGSASLLDLAIEVQAPDGEVLVRVGGQWDDFTKAFTKVPPTYHVVRVTKAQLPAARQLAEWYKHYDADDPDRVALEVYVDLRRGGKTFFVVLAVLLFLLRYPRTAFGSTIGWLVTPTYPQQRELQETIGKILPASWLREGGPIRFSKSERRYTFATGAILEIKSADRAEGMKAGGVSIIGINEAQQLTAHAVLHCLGNNIDAGGATMLAMNPPDSVKALWAEDLHDAINAVDEKGERVLPWARETGFPASENEYINQAARKRFQMLANILDAKQAMRDALGLWASIKDRAYPKYERARHYRPDLLSIISGWRDITGELNGMTGYLMAGDVSRRWGVGMDFQNKPWSAAIRGKALIVPHGQTLLLDGKKDPVKGGTVVFVILNECHNDPFFSGQFWTEEALCRDMIAAGWTPSDALVIGDGTGNKQGGSGAQRGREADPSTFSFPIVRDHGYEIHAPIERVEVEHRARQGSSIKTTCSNPKFPVRVNCVLELLDQGRLYIAPECKETAESFRTCGVLTQNKKPWGKGAHLTDAVGYLVWKWETVLRDALQSRTLADKVRGLLGA